MSKVLLNLPKELYLEFKAKCKQDNRLVLATLVDMLIASMQEYLRKK